MPAHTRESLIAAVQRVAARTGRHVSREVFCRETGISDRQYLRLFGSYNGMIAASGLAPYTINRKVSSDTLLRALRDAWLANGGPVSRVCEGRIGPYPELVYRRRWGGWSGALAAFQEWLRHNDPDFRYAAELERLQEVERRRACRRASQWTCGEVINFRGSLHAPTSEQGVVLLFGAVASDLGFLVETVSTGFPDCEAKRRGRDGWERLRIEFELSSRNFIEHGHDENGCDLIVCWEHDWPECPLPVLELKSAIEGMRLPKTTSP